MTFRTATKFSGLTSYPNSLSEVQAGALQLASNVVLDRPGVVSPRRGQRAFTVYNINLLTQNQATGGDTLQTAEGFVNNDTLAYGIASSDFMVASTGIGTPWQGEYDIRFEQATASGGVCLMLSGLNPGDTYTFSAWLSRSTGGVISALSTAIASDSSILASTVTTPLTSANPQFYRIELTFTAPTDGLVQVGMGLDTIGDQDLYVDGCQLETGAAASPWVLPSSMICSRLFQVRENLYGFFTSDGLPTSPGQFIRLVDTVDGLPRPASVTAAFAAPQQNFFFPPPANAVHSLQANGNTFFTTDDGIMKLLADLVGADSGTIVPAGMPYALDTQVTLTTPAAGTLGWLAGGYATAYRVVWGNSDPQGNLTLGAPSPLVVAENPVQEDQGQLQPALIPSDPAQPYPATLLFVALPWTATIAASYDVAVQQGGTLVHGRMFCSALAGATAQIVFSDTAQYFGPVGTPVSVVIYGTVSTFATPTVTFPAGFVQNGGAGWGGSRTTIYQPVPEAAPATTAGASAVSAVLTTPSATTVTVTAGSPFTLGPVGLLSACMVLNEQLPYVYVEPAVGPVQIPAVGDALDLPGVLPRPVVTAVNAIGTGYAVTLDAFPTNLVLTGIGLFDIYRPATVTVDFVVPFEAYLYTAASTGQQTVSFYQVYRSYQQAEITDGVVVSPTDEMQLCYQGEITGTSGASTISFEDIAPDATLGAALYTSPSQPGGILAARYQPPVASDMTDYLSSALFANCWLPARSSMQLLGVTLINGATPALQPNDVITINGVAFTAVAGAPATPQEFQISAGSGSVTADNNATVANLSRAVNKFYLTVTGGGAIGEMVTVLSTSSPSTMGGTFTVQSARGLGTFTLTFTAAPGFPHDSPFSQLPTGTTEPQQVQNALFYSPPDQPEACPLTNFYNVGQPNYPIQRVMTLPGSCIVFKPYEDLFQLPGVTAAKLSVQQFNTTIRLLANESAVALQSTIMCFTNQGVVTVSPNGVQITSLPINDTLLGLNSLPAFASTAFAVAHEAERRYMLWSPTTEADTLPTQAYSYNLLTNAWSVWPLVRVCGLVNDDDQLLYTGGQDATAVYNLPAVYKEASLGPAGSQLNYGDEAALGNFNVSPSSNAAGTISGLLDGSPARIVAAFGQGSSLLVTLSDGSQVMAVVATLTEVNTTTLDVTLLTPLEMGFETAGACQLVQATECSFAPVPIVGDDPGSVKQFQEFVFNFVTTSCANMECVTASDFGQDPTILPLTLYDQTGLVPGTGWGVGPWGNFPWGGAAAGLPTYVQSARQLVPLISARGHNWFPVFTARVALNYFAAQGLTLAWTALQTLRTK